MMAVLPISVPNIDWKNFGQITYNALQRNIRSPMDRAGVGVSDRPALFIGALAEFREKETNYYDVLSDAGSLLDHVFVSFLCRIPREVLHSLILEMRISIVKPKDSYEELIIASGNMTEWRTTVINLGNPLMEREHHILCSLLLKEFDNMGMARIFDSFSRKGDNRGGTLLTEK